MTEPHPQRCEPANCKFDECCPKNYSPPCANTSDKVLDETLTKIEDYCQAERENTRDANYPSKDYEHGMIIMSNRIHSFVEHVHEKFRQQQVRS